MTQGPLELLQIDDPLESSPEMCGRQPRPGRIGNAPSGSSTGRDAPRPGSRALWRSRTPDRRRRGRRARLSSATGSFSGKRRLEVREVVYVWADGIYVKAGLERDKAALLVVLGAMRDGTKEVLALRSGYRESVESCSEVLRDLKARGIEAPRLLMADGNAAIWGAVRQVWPEAGEQRCWNHKMRNVLDRLPQREQGEAKDLLRAVVYAPSRAEALKAREVFARRYRPWYPKAVDVLEDDWERMVAFYDFPEDHSKHAAALRLPAPAHPK